MNKTIAADASAKIKELKRRLAECEREVEECFNIALRLDASNRELPGAFTGTPSERIRRQLAARGLPHFK